MKAYILVDDVFLHLLGYITPEQWQDAYDLITEDGGEDTYTFDQCLDMYNETFCTDIQLKEREGKWNR